MTIYKPYTYLLGWSHLDKWYYGVRYARKTGCLYETGCHPDELWKTYFTSSKLIKDFRETHGEPDVIQIRKTFSESKSAVEWENSVLQKMKVTKDSRFLNQTDNKAVVLDMDFHRKFLSEYWTVERREEQSRAGKQMFKDHPEKIKKMVENRTTPEYSSVYTLERNKKISDRLSGREITWSDKISQSHKESGQFKGDKNPMYGRSAIAEQDLKWYNNGTVETYSQVGQEGTGFVRGRLKRKKYNDGNIEKMFPIGQQPSVFKEGKLD
jgi:hypothetical protein